MDGMQVPDDYPDALQDELAPYGLEFAMVSAGEDGEIAVLFEAEPESFARAYPDLGIEESYGTAWPPAQLQLWVKFDRHGDPIQLDFEVFDLLAWTASVDPELHDRLNTFDDPSDHAVAVGQALGLVLTEAREPVADYLE